MHAPNTPSATLDDAVANEQQATVDSLALAGGDEELSADEEDEGGTCDEVTRTNLLAIVACMSAHGIDRIDISYSGDGDEGRTDELSATGIDGDAIDAHAIVDVSSQFRFQSEPRPARLDDVVENALAQVLDWTGHDGWEDGHGGHGTLTIQRDGTIELDHSDYYMEEQRDERSFQLPTATHEGV